LYDRNRIKGRCRPRTERGHDPHLLAEPRKDRAMSANDPKLSAYYDGAWQVASGPEVEVINPADESVLSRPNSATAADVHSAVESANAARRAWARTPSIERGRHLRAMADVLRRHRDELAQTISREVGKQIGVAEFEVDMSIAFLAYNAEWDRRLEGETLPGDVAGETIQLLHEPVGVVAAICAWNFPLAVLCRKLGPALITGNTVVVKPSEIAPLSTMLLFRYFHNELELPPGVLNLVTGAGETGKALVDDPLTSMITFTGHRDTGKAIMAVASTRLARVALELGGKAPAIVWRDADMELAVGAIIAARHINSGQVCTSAERVLVHEDIHDQFVDAYSSAVAKLVVGDPSMTADLGPLASAQQLAKTEAALDRALQEGARLVTRATTPNGPGYWFAPAVLADVNGGMAIMRDEVFGPITPIQSISSFNEAITAANDSQYGLSAYLFSRDYSTVMQTVADLEFGEIYVNRSIGESVHAHHSGYRESGIGGEDGKWGLRRYTQVKTVYHHFGQSA
jgi:lactaldehyde dehydrogenase/glycolaldehyde dehydrogenase